MLSSADPLLYCDNPWNSSIVEAFGNVGDSRYLHDDEWSFIRDVKTLSFLLHGSTCIDWLL